MLQRLLLIACPAILSALAPPAAAQVHPELVVGCDAAQKLVVKFDAEKAYPLPASRFDGIDGYADAMPGFMSLFVARAGEDFFPADPQSNIEFVLVAADAGIAVLNDHGTGPMSVNQTFTLGHPPFDSHPVWNIATGATGRRYQLKMQLRDTTGRYQPSDVFAPAFAPDDATAVYVCPMRCALGKTYAEPGLCPVCEMHLKLYSGKNFRVSVTPDPKLAPEGRIRALVPTPLTFEITAPDGKRVEGLEVVHEKLVHLLMVSEDLSWFAHEHPEIQPDGTFVLPFAFPHGGRYVLYNDFTPQRVGMQVVPVELDVAGEKPAPVPLKVSAERTIAVDGYTAKLTAPSPITSLRTQNLAVHLSRDGKPVTDLEPFLGAMGHLIVISQDRKHFVHSHPLESARSGGPDPAARRGGPEVVFSAQFPAPGLYKAWSQFQHKGRVITAPFVIEVVSMLATTATEPASAPQKRDDR